MAKRLAAQRHLKALWLHVNIPISDDFHSADAIGTLKNLQHLSYYKDAFWGRKGWSKSSPELLIWNSRSTLRSLELNASTFHYMHFQWEESGDEPPRQGYLSALKSFSLVDGEFDDEQTDAIIHAIDFVKLEELSLGQTNTRVGLLYKRLIDAFSAAREGDIRLQSLSMNLKEDAEDGMEFLSCFDTLTRLTICNNGINPGETENPIPEESLWQALYKHKDLTILKLTDDICSAHDTMPGLDAQTAAKFIINFPNLRHLHFYLHESKLETVAEALSHAKNLKKVCAKTHRWQGAYQEKQVVALRFLQSLVLPVLARTSGEGSFIWEEHSKIKHVVCDVFKFEVGSKFEYVKGAKKAQKIESPWNKKHQVLFRFVPLEQTHVKGGIHTMRKWADKVARDLN
ncbi:hypothetical protein NW768_006838 [Fusarium equiseti]|uniref:Uncharacterized protein n=1 Tax=Fusarium equiseti TaxID=61235 RepID=A0ABQ8R9C5_FUSEQ|nr:hypothetical protein NW768_006838 [Fusarium equiseti]